MAHFTYKEAVYDNLKQGDVLDKNEDLKKILAEVHPHYLKDDYKYFLVLTQTCDLCRRDGNNCNSRYVTLAAIRPLDTLINREMERFQSSFGKDFNYCDINKKNSLFQLLERLLNNNESEYFYLSEDSIIGLPEDHVAFLRLSISIKSELHYEKCLKAKIFELREDFRAKLGWMVGNMYSRVGTEDWVPNTLTKADFNKKIFQIMDSNLLWLDKRIIQKLEETIIYLKDEYCIETTRDFLNFLIKNTPVKENKEIFSVQLKDIISKNTLLTDREIQELMMKITTDPIIKKLVKS